MTKTYTIICTTKANRTEYLHAVTVEAANVTEAKAAAAQTIRSTLDRHAFTLANEGTKDANYNVDFCARRYGMTAAEVIEAARAPQGIDLYGATPAEIVNEAMQEATEATNDANDAEHLATAAAIEYDAETAAASADRARRAAIRAEQAASKAASVLDRMAGVSSITYSTADSVSELAASARTYADRATETAKQCARELEERAQIIAQIEDPQHREYIRATAEAHRWTPEETRANVAYYAANRAANAAARALLAEYAETTGRTIEQDDDEYIAAYRVAHDETTGVSARATEYDREIVAAMVEAIAKAVRDDMPTGPEDYHAQLVRKADDAAVRFCAAYTDTTGIVPFFEDAAAVCRVARADVAHEYGVTAADRETVAAMIEELADAARRTQTAEPRPTYQRVELLAYLGEPDDYDVTAIEHDATAYDPETGRTVWTVDAETLAVIAERHQLQFYAPAF